MLYSILIYAPEDLVDAMSKEEEESHISRHLKVHEKLSAAGRLGPCVRLMPTTTAVQFRTSTTAHIVDCKSLEDAIEVARSLPSVRTIFEIRPVKLFFPGDEISPILPPRAAG